MKNNILNLIRERMMHRKKEFLSELGFRLAENARRRIIHGKTPNGSPHQALSPITITTKRGSKPLRDTGQLLKSITYEVDDKSVRVGSNLIYARVHQEGATIRAKKSYLTIPLHFKARQVAKGAGATRYGGNVRNISLFTLKTKKGRLFLVQSVKQRGSKKRKLIFWYMLKKQVKIPARPFLPKDLSAPDDTRALNHALRRWFE